MSEAWLCADHLRTAISPVQKRQSGLKRRHQNPTNDLCYFFKYFRHTKESLIRIYLP